jgi:alpha-tubulin suppressor-like RCC1 family protein
VVSGGISFVDLGIGIYHTCGLTTAGKAYCWGQNLGGELGDATHNDQYSPVPVSGNDAFVQVVAGYWHTCGLTSLGETKCWGEFNVPPYGPKLFTSMKFTTLTHGNTHACGLTNEGVAYCWHTLGGGGGYGQIGDGTTLDRYTPTRVIGGLRFVKLSAGGAHTCALDATGKAYCWGFNNIGQIGDGTMGNQRLTPTAVATPLRFADIQAGNSHTCALNREGKAFCWGNGGMVGQGTGASELLPIPVGGTLRFRSLSAKGVSTCGVALDDSVYCWGWNYYGGVGIGTTDYYVLVPTKVAP